MAAAAECSRRPRSRHRLDGWKAAPPIRSRWPAQPAHWASASCCLGDLAAEVEGALDLPADCDRLRSSQRIPFGHETTPDPLSVRKPRTKRSNDAAPWSKLSGGARYTKS